jgi:hypothetical protein
MKLAKLVECTLGKKKIPFFLVEKVTILFFGKINYNSHLFVDASLISTTSHAIFRLLGKLTK